jgi:hypothetical protein
MVPHFFQTLLQRSAELSKWTLAELSKWTLAAEAQIELLRCGYAARCSHEDCRHHRATTIVRHLDAQGHPLREIVEVCDEHADLIKHEQRRLSVRDFRGLN